MIDFLSTLSTEALIAIGFVIIMKLIGLVLFGWTFVWLCKAIYKHGIKKWFRQLFGLEPITLN